jgi:hypothetical protein
MARVLLLIVGAAAVVQLFILLTDGKYLGKGLMRWTYDQMGPVIFGERSGAEVWRRSTGWSCGACWPRPG